MFSGSAVKMNLCRASDTSTVGECLLGDQANNQAQKSRSLLLVALEMLRSTTSMENGRRALTGGAKAPRRRIARFSRRMLILM